MLVKVAKLRRAKGLKLEESNELQFGVKGTQCVPHSVLTARTPDELSALNHVFLCSFLQ